MSGLRNTRSQVVMVYSYKWCDQNSFLQYARSERVLSDNIILLVVVDGPYMYLPEINEDQEIIAGITKLIVRAYSQSPGKTLAPH